MKPPWVRLPQTLPVVQSKPPNDQDLCIESRRLPPAHLYTVALPMTPKTFQVPKSKRPLSSALRRGKKVEAALGPVGLVQKAD